MSTSNGTGFMSIVIVIMMVLGLMAAPLVAISGGGVESTQKQAKQNTFKNEVLTMINSSSYMYSELSMSIDTSKTYIKSSTDGRYSGMCISLDGLVDNGYLDKDVSHYGGVILVEVPYDGGATIYMAWVHNSVFGINGVERSEIANLKLANSKDGFDEINGGEKALTTNLVGIKKMVKQVEDNDITTISSPKEKGGTGATYKNIRCIKDKVN